MKYCFILLIISNSYLSFSQLDTVLFKSNLGNQNTQINSNTISTNKKGMPDLIVTSANIRKIVSKTKNGQATRYRVVQYVIKNIGTAKADLGKIKIQGFLDSYGDFKVDKMIAHCGTFTKQSSLSFIKPGATVKGSYLCAYDRNWDGKKFYLLMVDYDNAIHEQNENNNTKVTTINYIN